MEYSDGGLTEKVIGCVIRVHKSLGPGFLESVYRRALMVDLEASGLAAETEKEVVINYLDHEVGRHRLDVLVEGRLILELKTVENISVAHYAQVRSYLKATELPLALLINFTGPKSDIRRIEANGRG